MRSFLAALVVLTCAALLSACATQPYGAQVPLTAAGTYAAPPGYTLMAQPGAQFGVTPAAKKALMIPADTAACLVSGGTKILGDVVDTARCCLDTIVPTVTPVVAVPNSALGAAPGCAPVMSAAPVCAPPPARAACASCGK